MKLELEEKSLWFLPVPLLGVGDLRQELLEAWGRDQAFLLGHAYDGVLWGVVHEGEIKLARDSGLVGADLDPRTAVGLRLFNDRTELRVWCDGGGLSAVKVVEDGPVPGAQVMLVQAWADLSYELLGAATPGNGSFVERVGRGGQRHAPPRGKEHLRVRRYFTRHRETGLVRESAYRLMNLA